MRNENLFERDNSSLATISPIIFEKAGRPTNSRGRPKTDHPNLCESLVLPTAKYRCISIYSPLPLSLPSFTLTLVRLVRHDLSVFARSFLHTPVD